MYLAFYKVINSKNYERDTFDDIYDEPKKILSKLRKLNDDEWKIYEIATGWGTRLPSLNDFVEDYNDEELDGGWWVVLIN